MLGFGKGVDIKIDSNPEPRNRRHLDFKVDGKFAGTIYKSPQDVKTPVYGIVFLSRSRDPATEGKLSYVRLREIFTALEDAKAILTDVKIYDRITALNDGMLVTVQTRDELRKVLPAEFPGLGVPGNVLVKAGDAERRAEAERAEQEAADNADADDGDAGDNGNGDHNGDQQGGQQQQAQQEQRPMTKKEKKAAAKAAKQQAKA